jgi:hypothetical protein
VLIVIRIEFPGHGSRIRPKPLPTSNGQQPRRTGSNQSLHSTKGGPGGEGEEDGDGDGGWRREYVLVDETNAVEFNRVVDGTLVLFYSSFDDSFAITFY